MDLDFDQINDDILQRVNESKRRLLKRMQELNMKHGQNKKDIEMLTGITTITRKTDNLISRIRYRFKRSGVFVHKGVGKGRPASKPVNAKEWFNPIIEEFSDELAEEVLDGILDVSSSKLRIK